MKRKIVILGSTGSIGKSCMDVIRANRHRFEVVGIAANSSIKILASQIKDFAPKAVAVADKMSLERMKNGVPRGIKLYAGEEGILEMLESLDVDVVVSAIVGAAGLLPTLASIRKGIRVGIANKEPLVMAGRIMMEAAKKHGASIIPIDSEHSALWQCLNGEPAKRVRRIILTASGGPFRNKTLAELKKVTVEQALKHPKWKMGAKITIDSSTMMNKGLEVIEAYWLFGMPAKKIDVVVHPQSIVHSMVEFVDTSVIAQLGLPDMRVPIAYALSYPDRWPSPLKGMNPADVGVLEFSPPDTRRFPCLSLAYQALERGGVVPAVLNAANEVAVDAFLNGKIRYLGIPAVVEKTMAGFNGSGRVSLKSILQTDLEARDIARSFCERKNI